MKPEKMLCTMVESAYTTFIAILETYVNAPKLLSLALSSLMSRLINIPLVLIQAGIDVIVEAIDDLYDMLVEKAGQDNIDVWCNVAYMCQPLIENLDGFPFYLDSNDLDTYEKFRDAVCVPGALSGFVEDYMNGLVEEWREALNSLQNEMNELIADLEQQIAEFMNTEAVQNLIDQLEELEKYTDCAFALCAAGETAANKIADVSADVGIIKEGNSWVYATNDTLDSIYDKVNELDSLFDSTFDRIDSVEQYSKGENSNFINTKLSDLLPS